MIESIILKNACPTSWYAHCYAEYMASVARKVDELRSVFIEAIDLENVTVGSLEDILNAHGFENNIVYPVEGRGYTDVRTLLYEAWYRFNSDNSDIISGYADVEEVLSDIYHQWTHSIMVSEAFKSIGQAKDNIVDRVSSFMNGVNAAIPDVSNITDSVQYYKSMLESYVNLDVFIDRFLDVSGIKATSINGNTDKLFDSDLSKYTGHTPGVALNFDNALSAIGSSAATICKGIISVFKSYFNIRKQLFRKAVGYVDDTLVDYDVVEFIGSDKENTGAMNGWAYLGEFYPNYAYSSWESPLFSILEPYVHNKYTNEWIKLQLFCGEIICSPKTNGYWQAYFKPFAIDLDALKTDFPEVVSVPAYQSTSPTTSLERIASWVGNVAAFANPCKKTASKELIARSYIFATDLCKYILQYASYEMQYSYYGSVPSNLGSSIDHSSFDVYWGLNDTMMRDKVSNIDMIHACAGKVEDGIDAIASTAIIASDGTISTTHIGSLQIAVTDFIALWAMSRRESELNPLDYPFVPFSNSKTDLSAPSWQVKTDDQIAETRDNFIEAAIVAVIVIAATVYVGANVLKLVRNLRFKAIQGLAELDSKMWEGKKLTNSEQLLYDKYTRKLSGVSLLNSGYVNPDSGLGSTIKRLVSLIQG